jgi:hypothetical protein
VKLEGFFVHFVHFPGGRWILRTSTGGGSTLHLFVSIPQRVMPHHSPASRAVRVDVSVVACMNYAAANEGALKAAFR